MKELLHKFFKNETTVQEEVRVRSWIEKSTENKNVFFQERNLYDAILLNKSLKQSNKDKIIFRNTAFWNYFMRIAAVFLLITTVGLLVNKNKVNENNLHQLHTVIVPPGQRINLVLADNSSIWLNSNTTFKYPARFSRNQREVFLDGEAYFNVSANDKSPFIVNTLQGGVKVTGTTFNVSAYSKNEKFETSLFEGNVSIFLKNNDDEIFHINPAHKAYVQNGKLKVTKIKDYNEFLWRKGLISFKDKKLDDIVSVLGNYFNTEIKIVADRLPNNTYTGKFRQSDGIDYALRVLQKNINFRYERDEKEQIIYIKNN